MFFAASLAAPLVLGAEEEHAQLTYRVASKLQAECPDVESFHRKVAARLGYQPFTEPAPHRVSVELKPTATGIAARAEVLRLGQTAPGVRTLEGKSDQCEAIVAALATAVAMAIDPVRASEEPPPLPPTATVAPTAAPAPAPTVVQHESPRAPSAPVLFFGAASALASFNVLPAAAFGGELGFGMRYRSASIELAGRAEVMPSPARVPSGDAIEGTIFSGVASPCARVVGFSLCGVFRVGALQGRAPELERPSLGTSLFAAVGGRIGYTFEFSSIVALRALVGLEIPLVRTTLILDRQPVWTAPPVAFSGQLGFVFTLPHSAPSP